MTFKVSSKADKTSRLLWVLVGALGLAGTGMLALALIQPSPPRNLADPMPLANVATQLAPMPQVEPSVGRKLAQARNDSMAVECENRFHDCELACRHYPKKTPPHTECMTFCNRSKANCMSWTHR